MTVLIQFGEILSTFRTHCFQPGLWVQTLSAVSNIVALQVQDSSCCTGAASSLHCCLAWGFQFLQEKKLWAKEKTPKTCHRIRRSCTSSVPSRQTEALAVKIYLSLPNFFASWAPLCIRAVRRDGNSLLDIQRREGLSDLGYNEVVHCRGWLEVGKTILAVAGMLLWLLSLCCPCTPGTGVSLQKSKSSYTCKTKSPVFLWSEPPRGGSDAISDAARWLSQHTFEPSLTKIIRSERGVRGLAGRRGGLTPN